MNTIAAVKAGSSVDPCCCNDVPCSLGGQYKSGIGALGGFSEPPWVGGSPEPSHASSPPKKFLRMTYSGNRHVTGYYAVGDPCTNRFPAADGNYEVFGSCYYDPMTLVLTNESGYASDGTLIISTPTGQMNCNGIGFAFYDTLVTFTNTSQVFTGRGNCTGRDFYSGVMTGENRCVLSDEDTPANAVRRAESGLTWISCGLLSPCSSYTLRDPATFNVAYRHVQVQAHLTGMTVGRSYKVRITYAQRILGTGGPFIPDGDYDEITVTASATTWDSSWYDVPDNDGWETIFAHCGTKLLP